MDNQVCLVIRKAPYGTIHAAEAVRHINGALASGLETVVILMGDGVFLARNHQEAARAGWTSLSVALSQVPMGKGGEKARFYIHQGSLAGRMLDTQGFMDGFTVISDQKMAELVAGCGKVLLF